MMQSLAFLTSKYPAAAKAVESVTAGLISVLMLSTIAERAGGSFGEAVIHVVEPDIELSVGGLSYRIEVRRYDPIVCVLPSGRHRLVVKRDGQVLQDEPFRIDPGGSVVLAAWHESREVAPEPRSDGDRASSAP
jgi:hypothetical protein